MDRIGRPDFGGYALVRPLMRGADVLYFEGTVLIYYKAGATFLVLGIGV